jgi:gamma-glutamylcyclotransferase (GGCT)/AIG2-like uncharacterized protein YtfP
MAADKSEIWLFSYGSLREPQVQIANFGRLLAGHADTLREYSLSCLKITDPEVVRISGASQHTIIYFSGNPSDVVTGMVFRVTAEELAKADAYEVSDYRRVAVQLSSGRQAFVYVAAKS